jgi:hypothetical protein
MNLSEIDLSELISKEQSNKSNINLLSKISEEESEEVMKAKEMINNYNSDSYKKYLVLIENYFNEKKSKKYNQKFRYYVDEESRFVKEAIDKSNEKDNFMINVPKYINVDLKLNQLSKLISNSETKLRYLRTSLLNGNKSQASDFDKVKDELLSQMKDKHILLEIRKHNKGLITASEDEIEEIMSKRIQQNNNYTSIADLINDQKYNDDLKFLIKNYIQNNLEIIKYQQKIRELKEQIIVENVVEEVPNNEKKKLKFKPKPKSKKIKKKAGEKLEDAIPNIIEIPKLEAHKSLESLELLDKEVPEQKEINLENQEINLENQEINKEDNKEINLENQEINKVDNKEINLENQEINLDNHEVDLFANIDKKPQSEEINLLPGEDLEISYLPDLSGELEDLHEFESDNEIEENNVAFNSPESMKEKTEEISFDKSLPLFNEKMDNEYQFDVKNKAPENSSKKEQINSNNGESQVGEPDIDIKKLSKELNKKVSDNIKIVTIKIDPDDPNINFNRIKSKSVKK